MDPTNEQINERIAIEVMGWTLPDRNLQESWYLYQRPPCSPNLKWMRHVADWNPAEDMNLAMEAFQALPLLTKETTAQELVIQYDGDFAQHNRIAVLRVLCRMTPQALCLAILKATEGEQA